MDGRSGVDSHSSAGSLAAERKQCCVDVMLVEVGGLEWEDGNVLGWLEAVSTSSDGDGRPLVVQTARQPGSGGHAPCKLASTCAKCAEEETFRHHLAHLKFPIKPVAMLIGLMTCHMHESRAQRKVCRFPVKSFNQSMCWRKCSS